MTYILVIVGGGIGALLRYLSIQLFNMFSFKYAVGTLFVNCVGALLIGFLTSMFLAISVDVKWKLFLTTGFLGGYTTFSTYALETVRYFMDGNIKHAVLNIALNNVLCLLFVLLGMFLGRILITK
ncbi:MAG: fluoride efflux transporter CrcB [Spirochaetaceae bacterium]|jgi:CrcB protein|nr:fluoride efflux transporter CrcB [Spirochaetaceae bacterium]